MPEGAWGVCCEKTYWCPTSRQSECRVHGGFDACCDDPSCPGAIKQTSAKVWNPCPKCGGWVPEETVWVFQAKFYCSESCAREAAKNL